MDKVRPLWWAPCSFGAPKPGGPRTESPTSLIAWCTPNASAAPCASAPSSISVAISIFPRRTGRCCAPRVNDALSGQAPLVADCPPAVDEEAQRVAAQLIARGPAATTAGPTDVQPVDVDSLRLVRPRSVGVEQVGLWALEQLDLPALLTRLGVNGALRSAATGALVGRLAAPASERATHRWLQERSGLGELLGVDFETVGAMQLYRASDALVKHREAIEAHLFDRAMGLFDLQPTVTLYDLTNTYFEGEASDQPQAQRGHSKEKRSDCPLLTLGLMLDASGFVRRSKVFAGNVREHRTLAGMLEALEASAGALVVMDRGVATDAGVTWLRDNGYRYLVVSRERHRRFDADAAVSLQTQSDQTVHRHKVVSTDPDEVRLYCYSEERAEKERGIVERFAARFETALTKLNDGLARPRAHKRLDQVWQRIGRLKGQALPRRLALPGRRHRQRGRRPGRRRHLDPPPPGRLDGYPSGRLLPAQQRDRLGRRTPCGVPTPRSPTWRPSSARSSPNSACVPSTTASRRGPTVTCSSPLSPTSSCRSFARGCARTANTPVGPRYGASWKASSASPPPSAAPTDARCMCARPPKPNPISGPSTTRSASTHTPAASARRSSDRPISPVRTRL